MKVLPAIVRPARVRILVFLVGTLLFASNCTLGPLQALLFHFTLNSAIAAGTTEEAHKAFYPIGVTLKKHYVRVSGQLDTKGAAIPSKVTVVIEGEDQTTGKRNQKITLKMSLGADGTFTATKRIKKNIPAGTVQTISLKPDGEDLPAGAEVWVCLDIAKKKGDLSSASECTGSVDIPTSETLVIEVLDDSFDPKSPVIQAGQTVRWVLRGNRTNHSTTEIEGTWDSGFIFRNQGDFFERTFPASEDGMTFKYWCTSHQACCEMQGSIRVGSNAPDAGELY